MKQLLALLMIVSFASCHSFKRAVKTFDANEPKAAEYCAAKFPVKPFTKTVTKVIQGKSDTVTLPGQMMFMDCSDEVTSALDNYSKKHIPIKCPPTKIITEHVTEYVHDTTVVENTANLTLLQAKLDAKVRELAKSEESTSIWRKSTGIASIIAFLLLALVVGHISGRIKLPVNV
jgi:hypothetical protein